MNADWGSRGRLGRKGKDLKKHKTENKRKRGWLPSLGRNELKRRESEDGHEKALDQTRRQLDKKRIWGRTKSNPKEERSKRGQPDYLK